VAEITKFYEVFHSYRYVGDRLVVRLSHKLTAKAVELLNEEYSDIVKSGDIEQMKALEEERYEEDLMDLPRLVLRHRRRDFGRLREFINAINLSEIES